MRDKVTCQELIKELGNYLLLTVNAVKLMQLRLLFLKGPSLINVPEGYFEMDSIAHSLENI